MGVIFFFFFFLVRSEVERERFVTLFINRDWLKEKR